MCRLYDPGDPVGKIKQGDSTMVRKIIMAVAAGLCVAAYAEDEAPIFEVKGVEISGYLDMSVVGTSSDSGDDELSAGLDAAEFRFKSELADGVAIEAHVVGYGDRSVSDGNATTDDGVSVDLEQAFVSYTAISNITIIGGKWLSSLGWEAYHAPDLYQYSTSATLVYPGMMNGVGAAYSTDMFTVFAAALSGIWDSDDKDPENGGFEGHVRFTGIEDFTLFVGGATEEYVDYDQTLGNIWASYVIGDLLIAGEVNLLDDWGAAGNEGFGWLAMLNYGITDKLAITLRTSALTVENDAGADITDDQKFTIAPSYALTDNLSFVLEFNTLEDLNGDTTDTYAFETIVTF